MRTHDFSEKIRLRAGIEVVPSHKYVLPGAFTNSATSWHSNYKYMARDPLFLIARYLNLYFGLGWNLARNNRAAPFLGAENKGK